MARRGKPPTKDERSHKGGGSSIGLATEERSSAEPSSRQSRDERRTVDHEDGNGWRMTPIWPSVGADFWPWSPMAGRSLWSPQVESFRRGNELVIRADLPGLQKEDVKVQIENSMLTIAGERFDEHEGDADDFERSETGYVQFYRAIALPEGVDADDCDASFRDGVLEVTFPAPSSRESKTRTLQIH